MKGDANSKSKYSTQIQVCDHSPPQMAKPSSRTQVGSLQEAELSLVGPLESSVWRYLCFLILHCGHFFPGDDLVLPCEVFFTFLKDSRTEVWWTIDGKNTDDIVDAKVTQR